MMNGQKAMASRMVLCATAALLALASACSVQTSVGEKGAAEKAIRDLDAQWSKAAVARDLEATVSYYSDDASVLAPNAPIATGKAAIRAAWASMLVPEISLLWQSGKVEVSLSGDMAYDVGTYQMTTIGRLGRVFKDNGKFVEVWKKQSDGNWKVVADIFNSDLPVPPPPAPLPKEK